MEPVDTPRTYSGRYELTHLIARGGMAQVYRAMDRQLERPVALKVLSGRLTSDALFRERFRREGKHAAALEHPNIVPIHDLVADNDQRLSLVMKCIVGVTWSALLKADGKVPASSPAPASASGSTGSIVAAPPSAGTASKLAARTVMIFLASEDLTVAKALPA